MEGLLEEWLDIEYWSAGIADVAGITDITAITGIADIAAITADVAAVTGLVVATFPVGYSSIFCGENLV